jgi:haloalkane dehalogenase
MIPELPADIRAVFDFEPHWARVGGYRLHYIDEGPRTPEAIVLPHGNPTWSFLYRDIIPPLVEAGYRVVAPDHLGSGRSDHAASEAEYAIDLHAARFGALLDQAGVERAVFFLQDWGGPISLGACLSRPDLVAGMVLGNTFWGEASQFHQGLFPWRAMHGPVAGPLLFGRTNTFIEGCIRLAMPPSAHSGTVRDAYLLPWRAAPGAGATLPWPRAISSGPGHPTQPLADAIADRLTTLDVPTRFVWGGADPVFPWDEQGVALQRMLPRGESYDPVVVQGAGHFIQEWAPTECASALLTVAAEAFGRDATEEDRS